MSEVIFVNWNTGDVMVCNEIDRESRRHLYRTGWKYLGRYRKD